MTTPLVIDNTKRSMFRLCKRKYLYSTVHGLQPNFGSTAIRYGVTWHAIQEGFHTWVRDNGWPETPTDLMKAMSQGLELGMEKWKKESETKTYFEDYKNFNTAVEGFNKYLDYFKDDRDFIKIIHTEQKFECPIEPENEVEDKMLSKLPPIIFTGRIDLCVEMDYMKWIFDFKTTGWRLDQVISRANRSPQLLGYSYAGKRVLDFEPNGCLCSFAFVGATKSRKTGEYGGVRHEFRRVPQVFSDQDIASWKTSFIDTAREIKFSMDNDFWPESFDNCFAYGECPYLRLCRQHAPFDELNLDGFHEEFWDVLED